MLTNITPTITIPRPGRAQVIVPRPAYPTVPRATLTHPRTLPVITPLAPTRIQTVTTPAVPAVPMVIVPRVPVTPTVAVPTVTVPRVPGLTMATPKVAVPTVAVPRVPEPVATTPTIAVPRVAIPQIPVPAVVIPKPTAPRVVTLNLQPQGIAVPTIPRPQPAQPQDVTLFDWQMDWANRAYGILLRNHGYIDTSRMRSGKTVLLMWLARQFGFRLIVIGPVGAVQDNWHSEAAKYGVEIITYISYQSLRSKRGFQPKHGLLERHDNVTEGGVRQVHFVPTQQYLNLIESGVMLVCDEIQNIKNDSAQYKACSALMRPLISGGGRSRFALLSGTPFDKEEHATNLLRLIGYVRARRMYNYDRVNQTIVLEGMQELIDACRFINDEETTRVLTQIPPTKKNMTHLAFILYIRVVKAGISGAMAAPVTDQADYNVMNGFYTMVAHRGQQLHNAVDALMRATNFNERTGIAEWQPNKIGAVTPALVQIEDAKVDDFARVTTQILMENPRNKVVISVNYTTTIDQIKTLLIFYHPLILYGETPQKKRAGIVRDFNENPARRVLIMNTAVGGVGISLYSKEPDSPRYMLISPSYRLLDIAQAAARIYGPGMISRAVVRMFYGRGVGEQEVRILDAIARKTEVLKGTLEDVVTRSMILPGEYPAWHEPDTN